MHVVSLTSVVESLAAPQNVKKLSGSIEDFGAFFQPEVLEKLDEHHAGVFAFLAFDPAGDRAVSQYVLEGTLGSDAGAKVLAFFVTDKNARWPTVVSKVLSVPGARVEDGEHASLGLVRNAFPTKATAPFPGLLFFHRLATLVEPIFVSFSKAHSSSDVRHAFRQVTALSSESLAHAAGGDSFADSFASGLARKNLEYTRGGKTSGAEWFFKALNAVKPYKKDIVSFAAKTAIGGLSGAKGSVE